VNQPQENPAEHLLERLLQKVVIKTVNVPKTAIASSVIASRGRAKRAVALMDVKMVNFVTKRPVNVLPLLVRSTPIVPVIHIASTQFVRMVVESMRHVLMSSMLKDASSSVILYHVNV
jgi:FixJ family two-component response regulator